MSFEELHESLNKQKKKHSKTKWNSFSVSLTKRYTTILSKCQFCLSTDSLKGVLTKLLPQEKQSYFILQFLLWSFPMRQMFSLF